MRVRTRRWCVLAAVAALVVGAPMVPAAWSAGPGDDLRARLEAIPGMTVTSESQPSAGYRFFMLTYRQPVDHHHPGKGTFTQRLTLLHTSTDRPMVFETSGYGVPTTPARDEVTQLVGGNQISVEHRFFPPSRPDPAHWDDLTIWQEAADEHRIVRALRPIYPGRWIGMGVSKGGMTQVFHRYFYPRDLDGTVAYVAPNDAYNDADEPYTRFFDRVGTESCRSAVEAVQRVALGADREAMVAKFTAAAKKRGLTFDQIFGTVDRAFELGILDLRWTFWQYGTQSSCASVPAPDTDVGDLYNWINSVFGQIGLGAYTDQGALYYVPYEYQAATQLGWPALRFDYLRDVTRYCRPLAARGTCRIYQANTYLPAALRSRYERPSVMPAVSRWVRRDASRMMFIYGQNDPYSAPGKRFLPSHHRSFEFVAPGGNHLSTVADLDAADRAHATSVTRRWAGVRSADGAPDGVPALDHANSHRRRPPL